MDSDYYALPVGADPSKIVDAAGGAGISTSIINLAAAVLGAGMLGLPYGFAEAGWLTSIGLLVFSGVISTFTMHILSIVSREVCFAFV